MSRRTLPEDIKMTGDNGTRATIASGPPAVQCHKLSLGDSFQGHRLQPSQNSQTLVTNGSPRLAGCFLQLSVPEEGSGEVAHISDISDEAK